MEREIVDLGGIAAGDVAIAEVFSDDGAVLAFHQGIVIGFASTGLGELAGRKSLLRSLAT